MATEDGTQRLFVDELDDDLTSPTAGTTRQYQSDDENNVQVSKSIETLDLVRESVIGKNTLFESPFGSRALCYADYTASGKSLSCIEDYITNEVLPVYGNTHTGTSLTGLQTTCFRHEARQIIAQAVNARITGRAADDCVLFTGQGTTSAIATFIQALGVSTLASESRPSQRPVVFVGPFEHHSNLLPWRESGADIVRVPELEATGQVNEQKLEAELQKYASRPLKIGAFSAASNLTGVLADADRISTLLHAYGALACWDYASCAPYVPMDMNPISLPSSGDGSSRALAYKDAIFFSGHKFVGGPGSPGVLVVKKKLLDNAVPTRPGGGTVFFVTELDHRYLSNRVEREEGGTPDIIGSIRLGLAFEFKQRIGAQTIMRVEEEYFSTVKKSLQSNENIVLLGDYGRDVKQLPVFSFLVRFGDRFLHYNFVCALLNDLFGVQTRGGCQCAGPYASRLLGLTKEDLVSIENSLIDKKEMLRPGFSRVSFPYAMTQADLQYVLDAIHFVANEGWKFMPYYKFNHKSGAWKHTSRFTKFPNRKWLSNIATRKESRNLKVDDLESHRKANMEEAHRLAKENLKSVGSVAPTAADMLDEAYEPLRWFVYPYEAVAAMQKGEKPALQSLLEGPYQPQRYVDGSLRLQWESTSTDEKQTEVDEQETISSPTSVSDVSHTNAPVAIPEKLRQQSLDRQVGGKYPLRSTTVDYKQPRSEAPVQPTVSTPAPPIIPTAKLFPTPPKKLMRWVGQALMQWGMIKDGDRLLLGLSGGKDSLSLLHVLLAFQKRAPIKFDLACATVDPQSAGFDPSPLKAYMKALNIPYYFLSDNIMERATCEMQGDSFCSYCARMKRGLLYSCCREEKFNKLVLAQHLDDLAESFFMSAMHNGQLRTMKAVYWNDEKDIQVIRPLAYVREVELKHFATKECLPVINENCPACFEEPTERRRVKKMLAQEESLYPEMYNSLRRALLPLMDDDVYKPLEAVRSRLEESKQARSKRVKQPKKGKQ